MFQNIYQLFHGSTLWVIKSYFFPFRKYFEIMFGFKTQSTM